MKYTVLIRQPVPDAVRPELEGQLVSRFQLTPEQAARLAARRSGRLMKPTSHARASLLLEVFSSVGAQVSLEEVRDEGSGQLGSPLASAADPGGAGGLAALTPAPAAGAAPGLSGPDPFSLNAGSPNLGSLGAAPPALAEDPFAAPVAGQGTAPLFAATPTLPEPGPNLSDPDLPDWARPAQPSSVQPSSAQPRSERSLGRSTGAAAPASSPPASTVLTSSTPAITPAAGAVAVKDPEPQVQSSPGGSPGTGSDDWADFAGALSLPEQEAAPKPVSDAPRQPTEFLTEVSEGTPVSSRPRSTVTQQIQLGALLPLVVSSALMMGVLALTLPRIQTRLVQDNARSLASVVATGLNAAAGPVFQQQLDSVPHLPGVGFVRVSLPSGQVHLRADEEIDGRALRTVLDPWIAANRSSGQLKVGGENYIVSRVALVRGENNRIDAVPLGEEGKRPVLRRATVGIVSTQAASALSQTLSLLALLTLLGVGLAWWLANLAARRITGPLERLVEVADAISLGDLTRPVRMERNDEIGDLAQALERMRLSLEAAMERLRRRKRG